ncbi:MAG: S8 family serine peptidase [Candidatus Eisenbacteria bacterium]|uniref:S8 family serine peptidase n=1 Tax=Eiseniibacteriota bacterium TaxID=2212470 RepID=A0A937XDE9_UNCEI|nr:S8 family serine peptidase [Candidatus Eisenbacteria bacterium]
MRRWPFPLLATLSALLLLCGASAGAHRIELAAAPFEVDLGEPALPPELRVAPEALDGEGYFLVQARGPITPEWREELEAAGARIHGYIPEHTFLVRLDGQARLRAAGLSATHWVGPYHPAYKISPGIGTQTFVTPERMADPRLRLMVRVFESPEAVSARIGELGGEVLDYTDDGFSRRFLIRAPREAVAPLARIPEVWWIEEQPEFRTLNNATRWVVQSNASGWTPIWDQGLFGENEIVTIMDSGVDYNSCWFRENGNAAPGPSHRKVIDYSLFGGNAYDGCDLGHGTHVAGTICGDQSYINPGNYNYNGMAYKARLTVQDVGADDWAGCNFGSVNVPSSLTSAFNASFGLNARVHSNSWGSTSNSYDGYCVDVDNAMWTRPEFLVCFAAGNSGPGGSTVGSPGTAKNCVTVGATQQAPNQETIASYSSRGPASDSRIKPTVTAPGGESPNYIVSANNHTGNPPSPTCLSQGDPFQGTSMATPAVAGMALSVRQYFRDGFYPQGVAGGDPIQPTGALVKATLVSSSADMGGSDIPNNNEGWGRILLDRALFFEGDTRELIAEMVSPGLATGQSWTHQVTVDDTEELVVTLVWSDYPGTSGSGVAIVNDLDLTVTDPGGALYRGNVFASGQSTTGGSADRRNVEECVRRRNPASGVWTVTVTGHNVPQGPQPFAVVLNGGFADWPPEDFSRALEPRPARGPAAVTISPNPSPDLTRIAYRVPQGHAGPVALVVVDATGRVVRSLVAKGQRGGEYTVTWDGLDDMRQPANNGVYFARLTAGDQAATCKVVVQR